MSHQVSKSQIDNESSKLANTVVPPDFSSSEDDCIKIKTSSKKRKRDADDLSRATFMCFVCNCEVSGDMAMEAHLNSTQHKEHSRKRRKNTDSILATDKLKDSLSVISKPPETTPTTAKSSSIPDSTTLDSSVNLSSNTRSWKLHNTSQEYGLSSQTQKIICTVCECVLLPKQILGHGIGQRHQSKMFAMGMKGNEIGIYVPEVSHLPQPPKPSSTSSIVSKVSLQPGIKNSQETTMDTYFHCSACDSNVLYSHNVMSSEDRRFEQQLHHESHKSGESSLKQNITCTVCKCVLTGIHFLEHRNGRRHLSNVFAMGMKGDEGGIFVPDAATINLPVNACFKSSSVSTVSSEPKFIEVVEVFPELIFFCNVCMWEACGPIMLEGHLRGSLHASKVCNLGYRACDFWVAPPARVPPAILNMLLPRIARLAANDPFVGFSREVNITRFRCTLCKVQDLLGRQDLNKHLQDNSHKTNLKALEVQNDDVEIIREPLATSVRPATPAAPIKQEVDKRVQSDLHKMKLKILKEQNEEIICQPQATPAPPAPPATSSVVKPVADTRIRGFYCDTCAIYHVDCEQSREHLNSETHKKMVSSMASEGAGAVIPPRGSDEWVARLPPNVAYCTVCAYAVFHISMIDQHRRSQPHKKLLAEMGIQFDENGIPTALADASDGDADAVDVKPHIIDPIVAADLFFGYSVVDNSTEEQADL